MAPEARHHISPAPAAAEREPVHQATRAAAFNPESIANAQGLAGNLAIGRALAAGGIRPKLTVSQPGDPDEEEADRVADAVTRDQAVPAIGANGRPDDETVLPSSAAAVAQPAAHLDRAAAAVAGGGQPLPNHVRGAFEPRLAQDLSAVRIHDDATSDEAARGIGARAFTLGSHIAFASGEFRPSQPEGRLLLAHELAHTLQTRSSVAPAIQRQPSARLFKQAAPATADAPTLAGGGPQFLVATLADEPDLFGVPENASRAEIASRLLGDESKSASFQFVTTGQVPILDHKPAKAVRITKPDELTPSALSTLQHSLDAQFDPDVATVLSILKQHLIGDADESKLAEISLRWSQRSDIKSAAGTNYFATYLQRLKATTLTETFFGAAVRTKTALEWLLIEAEEKAPQIKKAIELRAPEFSTGYVVADDRPEFKPGDIIGRFYYSKAVDRGSVEIAVMKTLVNESSMQRADIAVRNSAWTGLRTLVPGGGRVYGYAVQPLLVNDPLVQRPETDFAGHYYWYHPGTVLINVAAFEKDFVAGGQEAVVQRTEILANSLKTANAADPTPVYGLDYDVLSVATLDQQIAMVHMMFGGPGSTDLRGQELIARIVEATPKPAVAALQARLEAEGLLAKILALPNPAITRAFGQRLTAAENENLDRLDGMTDVYALYRQYKTLSTTGAILAASGTPMGAGTALGGASATSAALTRLEAALKEDGFNSLAEFETAKNTFVDTFGRVALQSGFQLLDDNEKLVKGEYARYGGSAAGGGVEELKKAIGPLKAKVDVWETAKKDGEKAETEEQYEAADKAEEAAEKDARALGKSMSLQFPVLADPKLDLIAVVHADDAGLAKLLQSDAEARLADIDKARGALREKPERIWQMEGALAKARVTLGVVEGSIFDQILADTMRERKIEDFFKNLLIVALAIGLGVLSAGTGTVAVLAATAGAGISVFQATSHIQEFLVQQAAAGSAFDRAQALTSDDPSYFWLAVDIAAAILDIGMAAKAFSKLKPLADGAIIATDEAARLAKLKELEAAAKQLEAEAQAAEKAKQAASTGTKATEDLNKAGTGAKAAQQTEQLAPKVVADTKARISGKEALEKLGPKEAEALKALVLGDEAAAGGLARINPVVRAKVLDSVKSAEALRKLGNAVQESEHALASVEALHNVFVIKANRPDQFKAILEKYLLSRQAKQAEIFHVIGEAGLSEDDLAKIAKDLSTSKSAKQVGIKFGNQVIESVTEKLPAGREGIQKLLSISERLEQSTAGSMFEQWARKNIYGEGLGRFTRQAKDIPGTYNRTKVVTDSVRELSNPAGNAIVEFKNIKTARGFTTGTGEGEQLANYAELIRNGVKGDNGKAFVAVEYLFSNKAAAESASKDIIGLLGNNAKIFCIDPLTGLKAAL